MFKRALMRTLMASLALSLVALAAACRDGDDSESVAVDQRGEETPAETPVPTPVVSASIRMEGPATVTVGEVASYDVVLEGDTGWEYGGYNIHLEFDPAVVELESATDLMFGDDGFCASDIPEGGGSLTFACVLLGGSSRETGPLARVSFEAVAPGVTNLSMQAVEPGREEDTGSIGDRTFLARSQADETGIDAGAAIRVEVRSMELVVE